MKRELHNHRAPREPHYTTLFQDDAPSDTPSTFEDLDDDFKVLEPGSEPDADDLFADDEKRYREEMMWLAGQVLEEQKHKRIARAIAVLSGAAAGVAVYLLMRDRS